MILEWGNIVTDGVIFLSHQTALNNTFGHDLEMFDGIWWCPICFYGVAVDSIASDNIKVGSNGKMIVPALAYLNQVWTHPKCIWQALSQTWKVLHSLNTRRISHSHSAVSVSICFKHACPETLSLFDHSSVQILCHVLILIHQQVTSKILATIIMSYRVKYNDVSVITFFSSHERGYKTCSCGFLSHRTSSLDKHIFHGTHI